MPKPDLPSPQPPLPPTIKSHREVQTAAGSLGPWAPFQEMIEAATVTQVIVMGQAHYACHGSKFLSLTT